MVSNGHASVSRFHTPGQSGVVVDGVTVYFSHEVLTIILPFFGISGELSSNQDTRS
jgi:hypothetical protein